MPRKTVGRSNGAGAGAAGAYGRQSYHRGTVEALKSARNPALVTGCKSRDNSRRTFPYRLRPIDRSNHMKSAFRRSAVLAAFAVAATGAAFAHHSFSIFSMDKNVTYKGKVLEFKWVNPHAHLMIKVD